MSQAIKTLALMVTLVSLLLAPGSDSITATENPCKADFERLCGDVKPGQGRIGECLRAHKDETSQECKDFLAAKAEEIRGKRIGAILSGGNTDFRWLADAEVPAPAP